MMTSENNKPGSVKEKTAAGEVSRNQHSTGKPVSGFALFSWALYDWANSSFSAVILTFVFATYFIQSVAQNATLGTTQWGNAIGIAGVVIAILGPMMGALADQLGNRKPWILGFTTICIGATACLWFVKPATGFVRLALILVFLGIIGSEGAFIFYNAMLPDLAAKNKVGRLSGWAWGFGYAGGLMCLIVALYGFVQAGNPLFGLEVVQAGPVRATFILVAAWYFIFSLPLFLKHRMLRERVLNFLKRLKRAGTN